MPEQIQTTLRFSPEFHQQLRIEIAKRRIKSIQQAAEEAISLWIKRDPSPPVPAPAAGADAQYPKAHREAHRLLERILVSGTARQADWIVGNLKMFVQAIDAETAARPSKPAGA